MGLGAPYIGEAELDVVMDTFVALADVDDAEEAMYLGLFSALVEATITAQESGVATNRLLERLVDADGIPIAPTCAAMITNFASQAVHMRRELRLYNGAATDVERRDTDDTGHAWENLGAVH